MNVAKQLFCSAAPAPLHFKTHGAARMSVILMGVSGAGKTTVGHALAEALHWQFTDADDYHSAANVAKMRAGMPLTDADRAPWLEALHNAIAGWLAAGENVVLACSALKQTYRARLEISPQVKLVYLRVDEKLVSERLAQRRHHYVNPALAESQFATLEEPKGVLTIDGGLSPEEVVFRIRQAFAI
jgi:gluconokinase